MSQRIHNLIYGNSKVGDRPIKPSLSIDYQGLDWLALVRAFNMPIGQRIAPRAEVAVAISKTNNVTRFAGEVESLHVERPIDGISRVTVVIYHEV